MNVFNAAMRNNIEPSILQSILTLLADAGEANPAGASREVIERVEGRLGYALPEELRRWLMVCNGTTKVEGALFGVEVDNRFADMEDTLQLFPEWKKLGWIPVASDGCGNYYVLVNSDPGGMRPIAFIDTMDGTEQLTYLVGSNLFSFLYLIIHREVHDSAWPFGREWVLSHDPEIIKCKSACLPWECD